MNTKDLMDLALDPFRSRVDLIGTLLSEGTMGVREAISLTVMEFYCYRCREWRPLDHVHRGR